MEKINIIAEIANAHQGDPNLALQLAREVVDTGVDSIKFQIYFADEFLTTTHPRYEHFKNQAFSKEEWAVLLTMLIYLDLKHLKLPQDIKWMDIKYTLQI